MTYERHGKNLLGLVTPWRMRVSIGGGGASVVYPPDIAALVAPLARVWRFQHLGAWAGLMRATPLSDAIVEHAYRTRCRG